MTPGLLHVGGTGCRAESSLPDAATTAPRLEPGLAAGRGQSCSARLTTDRPLSLLETGSRLTGADGYRRAMAVRPGVVPSARRVRRRWYMRWWVWTAVVLLLALLILLGRGMQHADRGDDGILYQLFQRAGGGRAPKAQ
jgi:hypothetical protein